MKDRQVGSIWKNPVFVLYASCRFISNLGTAFYMIALPLTIYQLTGSGTSMGLMGMFETLPLLLGPLAGAVVDRMSRRLILLWSGVLQAVIVGMIPLLHALEQLQTTHMYLIGMLLGFVSIFMRSAEFAVIPILFRENIGGANAGLSLAWTSAQLIGPLAAGGLLALFDPFLLILLNAVSFLATGLVFLVIRFPEQVLKIRNVGQFLYDVGDGFKLIKESSVMLPLIVVLAVSNLGDNGLMLVIYYHLKHVLHFENDMIGWLTTAMGIGMLLGSLLSSRLQKTISPIQMFSWGFVLASTGTVLFLVPYWQMIPVALAVIAVGGTMVAVGESIIIQQSVPNEFLGRVGATTRTLKLAMRPVSMILLMSIAEHFTSSYALLFSFVLNGLAILIIFLSPLMKRGQNETRIGL